MSNLADEFVGCGVDGHDESCLCDVIITKPLPPLSECLKDGVQDMWMGQELCELRGYCVPWTDSKILDYLQDLEKFYDEYHANPVVFNETPLDGLVPLERDPSMAPPVWWKKVRVAVQESMAATDASICDIVKAYGLTAQEFIDAATGHQGGEWDWDKLQKLDETMMSVGPTFNSMCRALDIPKGVLKGLSKYWVQRRARQGLSGNPARVMLGRMALEPEYSHLSTRQIIEEIEKEFNVRYTPSAISKIRIRNQKAITSISEDN